MMATHETSSMRTIYVALAALGTVFGDIGTSPMYAVAECMRVEGLSSSAESVLGVISLIFWSLLLVVTVKYLLFIMRADNQGGGGIFAILALLNDSGRVAPSMAVVSTGIALLSAGLLLADSMITPALSVMAAVDGLRVEFDDIEHWIKLASLFIILGLFAIQRYGTGMLGTLFGPIMLIWFTVIAGLGLLKIVETPAILWALSPLPALQLMTSLTWVEIFSLMGSVMLAVTGAEAIYADMGHFGRRPISIAWYSIALLSLLFNYFGQGAQLLQTPFVPGKSHSPFFALVPSGGILPLVMLATTASIIASQAVISGMFSLASQAIHMNFLPRLRIAQTSEQASGQIYVPRVNALLALGAVGFVLGFDSPSAMAGAYGFAVATTMLLTTIAFTFVVYYVWRWSWLNILFFCLCALPLDALFFGAALAKLPQGGYVPALLSLFLTWFMASWVLGNRHLMGRAQRLDMPLPLFSELVGNRSDLHFQKRPAIFFQRLPFPADLDVTPHALLRQPGPADLNGLSAHSGGGVVDDRGAEGR
jgi:KUP system potassium uptake protein